jgi:hypothetical protein
MLPACCGDVHPRAHRLERARHGALSACRIHMAHELGEIVIGRPSDDVALHLTREAADSIISSSA